MSVLKIVAILGVLLGAGAFVVDKRQSSKGSKAVFVTLIVLSVLLFVVAQRAESVFLERAQIAAVAAEEADGEDANVFDLRDPGEIEAEKAAGGAENAFDLRDPQEIAAEAAQEEQANDAAAQPVAEQPAVAAAEPAPIAEQPAEQPAVAVAEPAPIAEQPAEQPAVAAAELAPIAEQPAEQPAVAAAEPAPIAEQPAEQPAVAAAELAPIAEQPAEQPAVAAAEPAPIAEQPAEQPAVAAAVPAPVAEQPAEQPAVAVAEPAPAAEQPAVAATQPVPEAPAVDDPLAPTANAGKDIDDGKVNEVIAFSAKKSKKNSKSSNIVSYLWDFGDGATADTAEAKHAYAQIGTYTATLTVTDADGHFAVAVRTVEINRPESKIKFLDKKIDDAKEIKATPEPLTGTYTKTFKGSSMNLEASGYMLASDGCTCEISLAMRGPGCSVVRGKNLKDGGEGNLTVKASCKGEPGEYTWSVTRKVTGNCACTFTGVSVEGAEG